MELIKLTPKFSELYTKTNYLAPVDVVVNKIIEYDMKGAGLSVIKQYKLLSGKKIKQLEDMPKDERNRIIGLMRRDDSELSKKMIAGIKRARLDFFKANFIKDEEVLSIKNDAIFVIGRKVKTLEFGEIKFVDKNIYSLYHIINGIELYYNKTIDKLDIKGINDEIIKDHEKYMVSFLKTVFEYIIYDRKDKLKSFLIDFSNSYKERKLKPGYYREFNYSNMYRYAESVNEHYMHMQDIASDDLENINISYNYLFFILPLLNRYLFM